MVPSRTALPPNHNRPIVVARSAKSTSAKNTEKCSTVSRQADAVSALRASYFAITAASRPNARVVRTPPISSVV